MTDIRTLTDSDRDAVLAIVAAAFDPDDRAAPS